MNITKEVENTLDEIKTRYGNRHTIKFYLEKLEFLLEKKNIEVLGMKKDGKYIILTLCFSKTKSIGWVALEVKK